MKSSILLKSKRNEIYGLIKHQGCDPTRFVWAETPSEINPNHLVSRLMYKDSLFFYAFDMDGETHVAIFSPAEQSYAGSDYPETWERQKESFICWLEHLKKEESEPDLWLKKQPAPDVQARKSDTEHYVIAEPSHRSPGIQDMESRLSELFEPKINKQINLQRPSMKRYYGKI